jgi:hypothetical protein
MSLNSAEAAQGYLIFIYEEENDSKAPDKQTEVYF